MTSGSSFDSDEELHFMFNAFAAGPAITSILMVFPYGNVQYFGGFVLIVNAMLMNANMATDSNLAYQSNSYELNTTALSYQSLNLTIQASNFGQAFDGKCFFGVNDFMMKNNSDFNFQVKYSQGAHWSGLSEVWGSPVYDWKGYYFCAGYGHQCGEGSLQIYDKPTKTCFLFSSSCPLKQPSDWTYPLLCPSCINQLCDNCNTLDRTQCTSCADGTNSVFNWATNDCDCIPGYYPLTSLLIPVPMTWQYRSSYVYFCMLNCTYFMLGCMPSGCTNKTYCSSCSTSYYLNSIDALNQNCSSCTIAMPNCDQCSSATSCSSCLPGWYIATSCMTCSIMSNCIICEAGCTKCLDNTACL